MARARCRCAPSVDRVRVVPSATRFAVAIVPSGLAIKPLRENRAPIRAQSFVRIPVRHPVPIRGTRFRIADTTQTKETKETEATRPSVRAVDTTQIKETGATRRIARADPTPIRADPVVRRFVLSRAPEVARLDPGLRTGALDVRPRGLRRVVILSPRRTRSRSRHRRPRSLRCSVLPELPVQRSPSPFTSASSSASRWGTPPRPRPVRRARPSVVTKMRTRTR